MEEEEEKQTTIRCLSDTAFRFNFLKYGNKFKNQDIFLNCLLDLFEELKRKEKQRREKRLLIKKK